MQKAQNNISISNFKSIASRVKEHSTSAKYNTVVFNTKCAIRFICISLHSYSVPFLYS